MSSVLLCHARSDRAQVRRLAEVLRRADLSPWLAARQAPEETEFDALKRALGEVQSIVLCLSPAALESAWVQLEVAAQAAGLLPQVLERSLVARLGPVQVPAALEERPRVDLFPSQEQWQQGAARLASLLGRKEEWKTSEAAQGQWTDARRGCKHSTSEVEGLGHEQLVVLAEKLERSGDLTGAERLLEKALDSEELPLHALKRTRLLVSLGRVKLRLGDSRGAVPLLSQALEIEEKAWGAEHEEVLSVMTLLAAACRDSGDTARAESLSRRTQLLAGTREQSAARVHARTDIPAPARAESMRQLARAALEAEDPHAAAQAALLRVDIEGRRGAWEEARRAAKEALALARQADDEYLITEAYRLHGDASLHGSLYEDARMSYAEAIRRYDALGNIRMAARVRSLLVSLLIQLRRMEGIATHASWLQRYLEEGSAPQDERQDIEELLALHALLAIPRRLTQEQP